MARNLPVEALLGDLIEPRKREMDRHAVKRLTRGITVCQRQLDFAAALRSYKDLVEHFPEHPRRDFALVRIATLLRGPLGHEEEALNWVRRAIEILPSGAWRDYLAAEHGIDMTS